MTRPRDDLLDNRAVTSVVGAILIAGLAVTVLATIRTSYVPVWEEKAERSLMRQVIGQLTDVKADLDERAGNLSQLPSTVSLPLADDSFRMFSPPKPPNEIRFERTNVSITVSSEDLLFLEKDGKSLVNSGPDETWEGVGTTPVDDILDVLSLRLRLDEVSKKHANDETWVNFTHKGDQREPLGAFQVRVKDLGQGPDFAVWYKVVCHVCADGNEVLYNQSETYFGIDEFSPYWVDLLNPEYRFDRVLDAGDPTMRMTLEFTHRPCGGCGGGDGLDLSGEYAITYLKETENGTSLQGGTGLKKTNFTATYGDDIFGGGSIRPGRIVYEANNQYLPRQDYILEHGAVIVNQSDGASFVVPPSVSVKVADRQTEVTLTLPTTAGQRASVGGDTVPSVRNSVLTADGFVGQTANFTVNLTTDNPQLWERFLEDELTQAGLQDGNHFTILTGQDCPSASVCLEVLGFDPEATDVQLTLRQATLRTDIQG